MAERTVAASTEDASSLSTSSPEDPVVQAYRYWYVGIVICYIILTVVGVIGNLLTVLAYWRTPSMHNPHHLLICQLSTIDLMVAVVVTPFIILNYTEAGLRFFTNVEMNVYLCLVLLFLVAISINMSLIVIFVISLERFIAIFFPYYYYMVITEKSVKWILLGAGVMTALSSSTPLLAPIEWQSGTPCFTMNSNYKEHGIFINTKRAVLLVSTAILNMCIAGMALLKKKEIQPSAVAKLAGSSQSPKIPNQDHKITKMLLTVVGLFYACWLPFVLLSVVVKFIPYPPESFFICHDYSKILVGLNSCLNPLIYARRNEHFRGAFARILARLE